MKTNNVSLTFSEHLKVIKVAFKESVKPHHLVVTFMIIDSLTAAILAHKYSYAKIHSAWMIPIHTFLFFMLQMTVLLVGSIFCMGIYEIIANSNFYSSYKKHKEEAKKAVLDNVDDIILK